MTNFKFVSPFFENIYSVSKQEITNRICTIHINNNKEIKIPLLVAVSFSSLISQMLTNDSLMTDFYIEDPSLNDIQDSVIDKLIELLNLNEIQIENEEIQQFGKLGKFLGNKELIQIYLNFVKENEQNMNEENVIPLIQQKYSFGIPIEEFNSEFSFVSSKFTKFVDQLIELGKDIKYYNIIESIVKHENLLLETEDELLLFILKLCEENNEYELLFENVLLEYCSTEAIREFIEYINKYICKDNHFKCILKCINRRLIQEQIPVQINDQKRYVIKYESKYEYNGNDPLNGLLRQEYLKGNVEMRPSSALNGDVYDLLKNNTNLDFFTNSEQNSWIEGNLKNKKPFTITKYVIRGNKYSSSCNHLQSWKLEGRRISDGNWIEIDSHQNEPFNQLVVKTFPIQSQEKFDAVRLTQTGKTTDNKDYLEINAFDIYGNIYTK